jgi:hypothetical protein
MPIAVRVQMTAMVRPARIRSLSKTETLHGDHVSQRGILLVLEARELEVQEKEMLGLFDLNELKL